jgi:hypothetical protein
MICANLRKFRLTRGGDFLSAQICINPVATMYFDQATSQASRRLDRFPQDHEPSSRRLVWVPRGTRRTLGSPCSIDSAAATPPQFQARAEMAFIGTNLTLCSVALFAAGSQGSWDVSDPKRSLGRARSSPHSVSARATLRSGVSGLEQRRRGRPLGRPRLINGTRRVRVR